VFSIVFAMAVLGFSFSGLLRAPLRTIGLWGPLLFILPIIATRLLAKYEKRQKIRDDFRRICAYGLIFGSILLALLLWRYEVWLDNAYADSIQPGPLYKEAPPELPRGPRNRR
jgi:hypothetical protein